MHVASILKEEPGLRRVARRVRQDPEAAFPLLSAKIKLSWRCNLRCQVCRLWRKPAELRETRDALSAERVEDLLSELTERGLRKIHFSGGEVLLLEHFPRLVRFARRLGLQVNFTTNGTLLDKDLARFVVEQRVHSVIVSIDSGKERQHDQMRGVAGAWKKSWRGIEYLRERREKKGRGPTIGVNTIVTRKNIVTLDALFEQLQTRGVDRWRLLPVDTQNKKLRPTPAQWTALSEKWEQSWRPLLSCLPLDWSSAKSAALAAKGKYAGSFYSDQICYAPWFNLFIDADGLAYPCCMGKGGIHPYGNAARDPLSSILAGERRREVCATMATGHLFPICKTCDDFLEENSAFGNLIKEEE